MIDCVVVRGVEIEVVDRMDGIKNRCSIEAAIVKSECGDR